MGISETALYLSGCALNGIIPNKSRLEGVNFDELLRFSEAHMISSVIDYALESAGIKLESFVKSRAKVLRMSVILDSECRKISESLENGCVRHMLMKGAVMKDYYPAYGLREMSDIDILIDPSCAGNVREIMEGLGFKTEKFRMSNHDIYSRGPLVSIEIHTGLMYLCINRAVSEYYYDVSGKFITDDGRKYTYHFSAEDFYLFMTAHAYKHYICEGTGLRSVLDEYVYVKKFSGSMNWDYISRELGKMNIAEFEKDLRNLALNLLGGDKSAEINRDMLEYIISSNAYGYIKNGAENLVKNFYGGSRIRYIFAQVFPPLSELKYKNPFVYRHKYLYPFYVIRRLAGALIHSRGIIFVKLRTIFSRKNNTRRRNNTSESS